MSVEKRIRRLQASSPFYAQQLQQHPDWIDWLDKPKNRDFDFRYCALEELLARECKGEGFSLEALRRVRRRMSVRIAYRELNGLASVSSSWRELTLLAEFVLHQLCDWRFRQLAGRLGEPRNAETGKRAQFCIFALGKLGAGELNFCSDLDLIFVFDSDGECRRPGRPSHFSTREFFDRFFRTIAVDLSASSADGALYHLDLRLRPGGENSPLARTASSLVNHYWDMGQTWERLAWLRARPVAGSAELADSILEEMNPFRYPRFVPPNITSEIAGVKQRIENEVPPGALGRDIKTGPGGIREIEFIAHALQLIHGGKNPFLQTHSTLKAYEKLTRYGFLPPEETHFLERAYHWLRRLENRLQMRGETPRHSLPAERQDHHWLADSMDLPSPETFEHTLAEWREGVRERYRAYVPLRPEEAEMQTWTRFLGGEAPAPEVQAKIDRWFPQSKRACERIRTFVLGEENGLITRERVIRFLDLSSNFDGVLPRLAFPMRTLERIGKFAACYGSRQQFFRAAVNPSLFASLALLFDRSGFIYELLCRHPGIMEELLREAPRRLKSRRECEAEIALLRNDPDGFAQKLWLYVKAEQVRMAIAELLHEMPVEAVSWALTQLAEAVVRQSLDQAGAGDELAVIALGKLGGEEMSFGSDLDLLLISRQRVDDELARRIQRWRALLNHNTGLGTTFAVDLRLRPHGESGPVALSLCALRDYHASGRARQWERQMLVRARPIAGAEDLAADFIRWAAHLLYDTPIQPEAIVEIWNARLKIEQEKAARTGPRERAFKTGPGGLLDLEFLAQLVALAHGGREPELRQPHARTCLLAASAKGLLPTERVDQLLDNWNELRRIEFQLRRRRFLPVVELPDDETLSRTLARWMGLADLTAFWNHYLGLLRQNRAAVAEWVEQMGEKNPG